MPAVLSSWMPGPDLAILAALLFIAVVCDWKTRKIPNALVFGGTLLGLLGSTFLFPTGLLSSAEGMGLGLALLLPLYLLRAMGAGDVKLMAMTGAHLGYPLILPAVLATLLAGGLLSLAYALWKGRLRHLLSNLFLLLTGAASSLAGGIGPAPEPAPGQTAGHVPYALAIASGTILMLAGRQAGLIH